MLDLDRRAYNGDGVAHKKLLPASIAVSFESQAAAGAGSRVGRFHFKPDGQQRRRHPSAISLQPCSHQHRLADGWHLLVVCGDAWALATKVVSLCLKLWSLQLFFAAVLGALYGGLRNGLACLGCGDT